MSTPQAFSCSSEKFIENFFKIALQINDFTNWEMFLQLAVAETRVLLQTDRVIIYGFLPQGNGVVLAEAVDPLWPRIQGQVIDDPWFEATWIERYSQGETSAISDIHAGDVPACYVEFLDRLQVRAHLVVPILCQNNLWGLLIAHQCRSLRKWQSSEVQLLQQMALQLGSAIVEEQERHQQLHQSEVKLKPGTIELQPTETDIIEKKSLDISLPESQQQSSKINHPANESERLECLRRYQILDTPPDGAFDRITAIAARFFRVPIAVVTLVDRDRIWFKSRYGLDIQQIDREPGLCASAIWQDDVYEIKNALEDPQTIVNPLVLGAFGLRFYAAAPLKTHDGYNLGTLCIIDKHPRHLSAEEKATLRDLAAIVMDEMELRLSARKLIEKTEAQRESEERWQLALRGNNDGIWDWNVKTNEVFFSSRWKEMLGFEEHEISNHLDEWSKRLHPDDLDLVTQLILDHFAKKTPFYISEHRLLCKDGSYKWILDRGQALWDKGGNVIRMSGSHTDISERKQAEFERRELMIALENAVSGISQLDTQGRYIFVNQSYANTVGYQPEEMIGMFWKKTVHPDDLEKLIAAYQQMQQEGKVEVEARGIRRDGSSFYKQVVMISIYDDRQQFIGHHCFMKDISDRKQAETSLKQDFERLSKVIATQQEIAIRNPNLDAVMAVIADSTQDLTRADGSVIEMVEGDELVYRAASGIASAYVGLRVKIATSLSGKCITTGSILLCHDSETDARVDRAACQRIGVRSMVVVPLFYQQERVGVLKVISATPSSFTESDIQTLQLMAGFLAGSVHLASEFDAKNILLSQLGESEERYRSVIATMTEGVVLQLADGEIIACNASAERIIGLTSQQMMGRTSVDLDWRTVREDGSPFPGEQHPATITLQTGKPLSNVVMGIHKADGTLTWISINSQPLFQRNECHPYAVVTTFADITERKQAEEIVRNQAQGDRLMAATDGLTQVANRRCFDERLQSEWHRLMQAKQQLSLIMLDVDYFKRYNDCYGHLAGDTCLVKVAKAAAAAVKRSADLFVRYGGEEFAAILPNTDAAGAIAVAESMRQAIRDLAIPHEQSDVSAIVTVSMGIASMVPRRGQSPEELIAASDRALYDAKRQGRDRYASSANQMTAADFNKVVE
ncbi:diguanylate cyclase [Microcoleus sp. F10-C6]|uniref:diguanylate cyclase domain-containing protein n=1 Tax=unclassified Microcoleus TaxID=2642155 RepID=UPI002FD03603